MTNLEKYKDDLEKLLKKGVRLQIGMAKECNRPIENEEKITKEIKPLSFTANYEEWYSESLAIIRQIMPNRLEDFVRLYKNEKRKEIDFLTYTISDYLIGLRTTFRGEVKTDGNAAIPKFQQQLNILISLKQRFTSSLFDIKQLVQADLFDSEIATATELNKKGFHRAAGVICGVIIEKHLSEVCANHQITVTKKNPTISDLNDLLKNNNVIDVIVWRFIQRLGDIRNLCGHNKDREPTKEEVEELVNGTDKIIKTVF